MIWIIKVNLVFFSQHICCISAIISSSGSPFTVTRAAFPRPQADTFHVTGEPGLSAPIKMSSHGFRVLCRSVLAQLRLADDAINGDFKTDDRRQLVIHEIIRRIAHFPGVTPVHLAFETRRKPADDGAFSLFIVNKGDPAMDVNNPIIPSRHNPVMRDLAGIPIRRDIAVFAGKDGKDGRSIVNRLVKFIGGRDMPDQPVVRGQKHRNVIRHQTVRPVHDKRGERKPGDKSGDGVRVGLDEMRWQIHVKTRQSVALPVESRFSK